MTASLRLLSIISLATVTSLVLRQLHDYLSASEVTLKNVGARLIACEFTKKMTILPKQSTTKPVVILWDILS